MCVIALAQVVGWPLDNAGEQDAQCEKTALFMRLLESDGRVNIPYTYWDERDSTWMARMQMVRTLNGT